MSAVYKVIYSIIENDVRSKDYGYLIEKTLKFKSYADADRQQRLIANTTPNLITAPIIDITGES